MSEGAGGASSAMSGAAEGASGVADAAGSAGSAGAGIPNGWSADVSSGIDAANANVANYGTVNPSTTQIVGQLLSDYNKGANGGIGDFAQNIYNGEYTKAAGYLGNKMSSAGGESGRPTPMIQLPQNQQPLPDTTYRRLYQQYLRRY